MTLLKRRNSLFPDLLEGSILSPRFFDSGNDFWNEGLSTPRANVEENEKEFSVDLMAPGLKKEDFKIEVEDGNLIISSEKDEEKKDSDRKYMVREYSYRSFTRTFRLPENVKEDQINAKYSDGVLHLVIPKKEATVSRPKKQIKVG